MLEYLSHLFEESTESLYEEYLVAECKERSVVREMAPELDMSEQTG